MRIGIKRMGVTTIKFFHLNDIEKSYELILNLIIKKSNICAKGLKDFLSNKTHYNNNGLKLILKIDLGKNVLKSFDEDVDKRKWQI
jgi:hypothetical protein